MWYIVDPFTYPVWLMIIASLPIYLLAMGLADYTYSRCADWDRLFGFILRNALSEQNFRPPNHTKAYQKTLIITWLWSVLVLVQSYSGNLTAMLAKASLGSPIRTVDELLNQTEVTWVIEEGTVVEYFTSTAAPGTKLKRLYERASLISPLSPQERMMYGGCFKDKMIQGRRTASLCDRASMTYTLSKDFSNTGKCNFYLLEEKILHTMNPHFAVQVKLLSLSKTYMIVFISYTFSRRGVNFSKTLITSHSLNLRWACHLSSVSSTLLQIPQNARHGKI